MVTEGRTDKRTGIPFYRDARTHLKREGEILNRMARLTRMTIGIGIDKVSSETRRIKVKRPRLK